MYVVSADRKLMEGLRGSGDFGSVVTVSGEGIRALLREAEEQEYGTGTPPSAVPLLSTGLADEAVRGLPAEPLEKAPAARNEGASVMPGDVWLVSDVLLELDEAIVLRGRYPETGFIYMVSNRVEPSALRTVQTLCAAHEIKLVPPYLTPEQVAGEVSRLCFARERIVSKVITAVGALPQLGLTSSLLGVGRALAGLSGMRVGILGLNGWNPGDGGIRYSAKYLDELWGSLQGKQLTAGELPGKMQLIAPNVRYLAGNRDLKKLYYYKTDGVSWLIEKARESFDIVLIDAGSYPDHALAAQGIHAADMLLAQIHQGQQAKAQWRRTLEHILQPVFQWDERRALLLFNQMRRSPDVESEKQLSRQLGMPYLGSLPYVSAFYRSEAEEGPTARTFPEYEKELQKVGRAILHYYNIPVSAGTKAAEERPLASRNAGISWLRWLKPAREA